MNKMSHAENKTIIEFMSTYKNALLGWNFNEADSVEFQD